MQPSRLGLAAASLLAVTLGDACSKKASDASVLAPQDLTGASSSFDASEILNSASMQDATAIGADGVEQLLQQTPYGGASFLATYASHGVTAASAVAMAAQRHAINPLVLLVRAEMDQGLVASATYPSPASRVEYAFGCGCEASGQCDIAYGGFDVQVDCLAGVLRDALDAIAATGKTAGGWGPGVAAVTADGVSVTPQDDSTAALYQYTPVVAVGRAGGNWLFWNLWEHYAAYVGYTAPTGPTAPVGWIGDGCAGSAQCVYDGTPGTCAAQFPGGLCTLACTKSCPSSPSQAQTFCADFGSQGGFCLAACNPAVPACRSGYACTNVKQFGDTATSQYVCFPK